MTKLRLALRDALYYKALPFVLRRIERFELPAYRRQLQHLSLVPATGGVSHLMLAYGRGGGADRHVDEAAARYEAQGEAAWILIFQALKRRFILTRGKLHASDAVTFKFPADYNKMVNHLRELGLQKLHIHHTRYLPYCFITDLPQFANSLGVPYDYMMHDFIALCPRVHLVLGDFHYCGMPDDATLCNTCVARHGTLTVNLPDVGQSRNDYRNLLHQAADVIAPSMDTANRHKHILGDLPIRVLSHDTPQIQPRILPAKAPNEPYVVAVIGRLHRYKGADLILACAQEAKARKLDLRFHLIGDSVYADALKAAAVTITGTYQENELPSLLEQSGCSLVFLPSVWPETYSYVLSEIWQQGYFPVVMGLGAQAERVKTAQNGMSLPYSMVDNPSEINDALLKACHVQHKPS